MRILVTGSRGVVGSYLMRMLKKKGHEVLGVDLLHYDNEDYIRADVSEFRQIEKVISIFMPEMVYHAAAEFGRYNGEEYYEQLWKTNVIGTKHIIRLQERFLFKLVHFSSSEVYGDFRGVMLEEVMEQVEIKQLNDYAMTKWVNEMQIRNSIAVNKTKTVIVRLFNTYGPGETYHPYRSVNARFCNNALKGLPIILYKGHYRTSSYLADTCRTLCNIVDNFIPGEVYNIGGTEYHSIEHLAKLIWEITGADPGLIHFEKNEPMTTKSKQVDVSKAVRDLKHQTDTSLKDGIKKTIAWMKKQTK